MTDSEPKAEESTREIADEDLEDVAGGLDYCAPTHEVEGTGPSSIVF